MVGVEMRANTKGAPEHLGSVLVLGLGLSGKSVARYCTALLGSRVERVFIAAGADTPDSRAFVEGLVRDGVQFAFGDDALEGDIGHFDVCIASPGIPYWHALYQRGLQASDQLISEVEFSWRESAADSIWVAITGTNGKTTTTSLAAHVLAACGLAAAPVGNIGQVCLDAVAAGQTDVYVAEVSSYQLASTIDFAPDVAVLLNITPDHVHWHKTLEAYRDAKFKMMANMPQGRVSGRVAGGAPVAVLDATNDVVRAKVRELRQVEPVQRGFDYVPMGTADGVGGDMRIRCGARNAAFVDADGVLTVAFQGAEHRYLRTDQLQVKGAHNAGNALAAAAVATVLGADDEAVRQALASFPPLEHRIEPCGTVRGMECYNDSKATNVDATVKALEAFPDRRVVVLLGGDDKGTDLTDLVQAVHAHATAAVCFGAGGPRFAQALEQAPGAADAFALRTAEHLEDALDEALGLAANADVVLLSPACASFDEFTSFEQRGDVFKQLVADRRALLGA